MSTADATAPSPESVDTRQRPPPGGASSHEHPAPQKKPGKRDRVALACQRCKTRKQKCDGQRPACTSCARLAIKCVYIVPLVPAAGEKKLYIKALEQRVAELESFLASLGHFGATADHFRGLPQPSSSQQQPPPPPGVPGIQAGSSVPLQQASDDDGNELLVAVRDLSLSASGHYVGASSNITIGRVLSSVVHSQRDGGQPFVLDDQSTHGEDDPAPKSVYSSSLGDVMGVPFLSPNVATRLIQGWFRHIATRYPLIHSARLMGLHNNRDTLSDYYDQAILHIVYAVSGRWLESAGEMGHFFSDQHYDLAFGEMDTILSLRDSRTVDYLLLMALYCTRAPRDPGAWTYVGAAMRICIELGLHRRPRRPQLDVDGEMTKRRFWTAYFLDRDISIAVGRPPSISDHDIDTDLPFDINEDTLDSEVIRQASLRVIQTPVNPPTTMTSFIHRTRLKKIESEIQHVVYRVDRPGRVVPDATLDQFIVQLEAWRSAIPYDARNYVQPRQDSAYEGSEFYTIHYHRCVRFLLYPQLAGNPVNMRYLRLCADACAGIIADYRRLHHVFPVGFSALSIQSVFLAGLTLIYCAWLAPPSLLSTIEGPLTDCQILLYIVTERYPSARKYRDVFERIKTALVPALAARAPRPQGGGGGGSRPGDPVRVDAAAQETFARLLRAQTGGDGGSDGGGGGGEWWDGAAGLGHDFSYMINSMTGNAVAAAAATEDTGTGTAAAANAATQFDVGVVDPMTTDPLGRAPNRNEQPASASAAAGGMGHFPPVWHGLPLGIPQNLDEVDAVGDIFQ
ncbi:fungal-specific transcription factor domain-containing protein [Xylariaceae sp. FL0804]|nr:fungal-specific transcription factor domain-containing protein [Xylariaceae sp. FL0804]